MIPFDYLRFRMNSPPIMKRNVQEQNLFYGSKGFSIWWKVANWLKFLKKELCDGLSLSKITNLLSLDLVVCTLPQKQKGEPLFRLTDPLT